MRILVFALAVGAIGCAQNLNHASPRSAANQPAPTVSANALADELLVADRSYSESSSRARGLAAIEQMLADDVVMFAVPVPGFARGRPEALAHLRVALGSDQVIATWSPIRVGLSADGRHGFTFGYATTRQSDGSERHFKYLSYWVRGGQGWHVALYKLVPREEGQVSLALMAPSLPSGIVAVATDAVAISGYCESLARREQEFSDESLRVGLRPAFARFGRDDAVNLGGGSAFVLGPQSIGGTQPDGPGSPFVWSADQGVIVASSGDLGATFGYLHRTAAPPPGRLSVIPFFTIWRRDSHASPWLYVAE